MRNLEIPGVQQRFVLILTGYREAPAQRHSVLVPAVWQESVQRRFETVPGGPAMSLTAVQRRFGTVPGGPAMSLTAVQRRFGIVLGGLAI